MKAEHGFTLIEMMIVILIISILLLIAVPSMTKNNDIVSNKSCEATIQLLQSQVAAYEMEHNEAPSTLQDLLNGDYVDSIVCPGNVPLELINGEVVKNDGTTSS